VTVPLLCHLLPQPRAAGSGDTCLRSPSRCTCCSPRAVQRAWLPATCGSGCWLGPAD